MSSSQPQPIDGIAGVRPAPWDDSAPRVVQVVSRHRAIDLMPLLCRKRPVLRARHTGCISSMGIAPAAESRRMHAGPLAIKGYLFSHRQRTSR